MDDPRAPRTRDTDGHIPRDWFRNQVWKPALAEASVTAVRPHDLRHAHASWLLPDGADLQAVKERLGHASIATTEKYLHTWTTPRWTRSPASASERWSAGRADAVPARDGGYRAVPLGRPARRSRTIAGCGAVGVHGLPRRGE